MTHSEPEKKQEKINIGIEKGREAAGVIGGFAVWPEFDEFDVDCPTDFNDLHRKSGLQAVRDVILKIVEDNKKNDDDSSESDFSYENEYSDPTIKENGDIDLTGDMGLPFKVLGYNEETYYYFPFGKQQIIRLTPSQHTLSNLYQLATLKEWKDYALRKSDERISAKEIPAIATDEMMAIATKRGVFYEESRVRGCGVWLDGGRVILHCGDKLLVDGVLTNPRDIGGHYVYAAAGQMFKPNAEPLTNAEAQKLRKICTMPTWENPLSGLLLAGWLVVAPVCAALSWRPHIFLSGEAGSGKSTILDEIIRPVLGKISLNVDSGTTESSIREKMNYDARPIVYDEAEGKGNKYSLMDGIFAIAKLSSKGGYITKRGQRIFNARSSFCFAAINPTIKDLASETRISVMMLKKNTSKSAARDFALMMAEVRKTITPEYGVKMLARTVKHMNTLIKNIETFKSAAKSVIHDARAADQVSAMLAGLYLLGSTAEISEEDAKTWIAERDWTEHTAIAEVSDPERLLHYIGMSIVNVKGTHGSRDHTIGTLIASALGIDSEVSADVAKTALRQYSILARSDGIYIGNKNKNMSKILSDTDWGMGWSKTLLRLPGAKSITNQYFGPVDKQRAAKIPAELFYGESKTVSSDEDEQEIIPFD